MYCTINDLINQQINELKFCLTINDKRTLIG